MLLFMQKVSPKAGVIMQQPLLEEVMMDKLGVDKQNLILLFPIPRFMPHKDVLMRPISEQQAIIMVL